MGLLHPTPDAPPPAAAAPPAPASMPPADDRGPLFQPADHLFPFELGDGVRATLPAGIVPSWTRPPGELSFDLRQMTIAEHCRARRMAAARSKGTEMNSDIKCQLQLGAGLRRIGDVHNPDDAFVEQWINDIGYQGWAFVWNLFLLLHSVDAYATKKFEASRRADVLARRYSYVVPAATLPRKRWAARTHVECKWVHEVHPDTLVDSSRWTVDGKPAPVDLADRLSQDLSFTMQEMRQGDHGVVADLVDDPDDQWATRTLEVMFSIVSIGGRALGNTPADLAFKRAWLEDIGARAQNLVTGTWTKLHEVDMAKMATFLDSATPLD